VGGEGGGWEEGGEEDGEKGGRKSRTDRKISVAGPAMK
jgi:hypothetical protein